MTSKMQRGGHTITRSATDTTSEMIRRALPELYPRLWRYAMSLARNTDTADDLTQQTCTRALTKAHLFDPDTHLDRWLFRILHNLWINEIRANKVRTGQGVMPVEDAALADNSPDQDANIFAAQVLSEVNGLPEGQRAAVMLVYVEGYRYREAADILGVPVGTIMSRLASARARLARLNREAMEVTSDE